MYNLWLLGACLLLGVALRRTRRMPEGAPAVLNSYVINIALPALTLYYVHRMDIVPNVAYSVAAPWLMFAIGAVLFHFVGKALGWKRETVGGIILVGSLANTSFVGLPMIESFYGAEHMGLGIVIDQLGTYLVLSTLGILLAAVYSVGRVSIASVSRRVLGFPPLLALILALGLQSITFPETLELVLERLGSTLIPIAALAGRRPRGGRVSIRGLTFYDVRLYLAEAIRRPGRPPGRTRAPRDADDRLRRWLAEVDHDDKTVAQITAEITAADPQIRDWWAKSTALKRVAAALPVRQNDFRP